MVKAIPSHEEMDALARSTFTAENPECGWLTEELAEASELLADPDLTPGQRRRLIARLHALSHMVRALHCPPIHIE